jgi:hypothetical protein
MDLAEYTSLVVDTAYALARANDPGGRLSDNDFNFALQTLGSISQDPASAKAAFAAVAERAYENVKFRREGFGEAKAMEVAPGLAGLDAQMEQFTKDWGGSKFRGANLEARKGGSGSSTSSSPAYTPAAQEFMKTYGPK